MPYSKENAPDKIKGMPEHAQEIWISTYNSAFEQYNQDEGKANAVAYSAIEKAGYKKEGDTWVKAERERTILNFFSPIKFEKVQAQKFVKEVIREGEWIHPQNPSLKFNVTKERMLGWVKNFKDKVVDVVTCPMGHSDKAIDNAGMIEDLFMQGGSLMAKFNILLEDIASRIGKTILGNSVAIEPNYIDTVTGENKGEVLVHIALTNQPHIAGLGDFIPVFASKDNIKVENLILLEKEKGGEIEMEELEKVNKKIEELGNIISQNKVEFEKSLTAKNEEIIQLQRRNREVEVTTKVDNLISEGKLKVEEREEKLKFGMEQPAGFDAFVIHLSKMPSTVEFGQRGRTTIVDPSVGNAPVQSELDQIASDYLTRKGAPACTFDKAGFKSKIENWMERFTTAGKKFLADRTSFAQGGIRFNRVANPEIRF